MSTQTNPIKAFLEQEERPAVWLAKRTGLAPSTVISHAEGKAMPGLLAIQAYHEVTGIPLDVLAAGWGPKAKKQAAP